jgi:hypothetical protein
MQSSWLRDQVSQFWRFRDRRRRLGRRLGRRRNQTDEAERPMRMRLIVAGLILAVAAISGITGCSGGSGRHGTVTGTFLMVGGPGPGVSVRLPGRVSVTNAAGQQYVVTVSSSGRFTMDVPPGTYQLAGYSPRVHVNNRDMRCAAAHPVHVRSGRSTHSDVYCSVP